MLSRLVGAALLTLGLSLGPGSTPATAASGGCDGASWGVGCSVQVPGTTSEGSSGGGGGAGTGCTFEGASIPCTKSSGTWSSGRSCYVRSVPGIPLTDTVWDGHTDGMIYACAGLGATPFVYYFWAATSPSLPDPKVLAQQAVTQMHLRAVTIGMAPEPKPGSVGLVGLPIWMWAASPDAGSWGPVTKTVSAGGYSVTATGKVTKVVWEMGDGGAVTCTSPGTPYQDSFGLSASPDCGYRYPTQGTYTVRATNYWTVNWSGLGQSGVINRNYTSSSVVTIGELQAVVKG